MCFVWQNTFVFCKTHFCFAKHICVFNLWGLFVELYNFGMTLIFLKNEIGFQENMESHPNNDFSAHSVLPPPFFPIQCLPGGKHDWILGLKV